LDANNKSKKNDEEQLLLSHNHTIDDSDDLETNKDKKHMQFFNNDRENEEDSYLGNQINNNYKDNSQHQFPIEPYNQPTPTLSINHSPNIRSILRQKNQSNQNNSPLFNTHLRRDNFQCNKSPVSKKIKVPSSPLKVNVNVKPNQNNFINDAPSSQVSSDSGYSGLTSLQMIHNKIENYIDLSPTKYDSNDNLQLSPLMNLKFIQIVMNPGLGFSIAGGKGSIGNPFKPNDPVRSKMSLILDLKLIYFRAYSSQKFTRKVQLQIY